MPLNLLFSAPVGMLPVVLFMLVLVYLDSYKLVHLRAVLAVIAAGVLAAVVAWGLNSLLQSLLQLELLQFARFVAPLSEELLKAAVVVYLFRSHRIGFLIDAAILGFAVGAGFALFENFYYLYAGVGTHVGVWVVRGFGTAIMHGGTMALFGILAQSLMGQSMQVRLLPLVPGFALATVLHSLFNHFPGTPILTTLATIVVLPLVLWLAWRHGARVMSDWLRADFDADAELLAQLTSPELGDSPIGRFLHELRDKFDGPVVVDMLCYLRVYTELAIRAKGLLLAREAGLEIPPDELTKAQFEELDYLERSIGATGLLAMRPFLLMERAALWQMNVLQR